MNKNDRLGRRVGFLCSRLEDSRRIELRQERFLKAYSERSTIDDMTEITHDLTKLRRLTDADMIDALTVFQQPMMYSIEYTQDREYPLQARLRLPEPIVPNCSFAELILRRRSNRNFDSSPLTLGELSKLLFCALGETGRMMAGVEDDRAVEASLRSIPSGGALHPTRVFVAVLQPGDLTKGVYHYDAPSHELECVKPLSDHEIEALFAAFPMHPRDIDLSAAAAIFFITTKFWRTRAKYGPRGYRYSLQEAGAACQNLSLTAVALGLAHVVVGGFYDDEVHDCLEIDGVDHAIVTTIVVGAPMANVQKDHKDV